MDVKLEVELMEYEELARDAKRYRKLRKCHWNDGGIAIVWRSEDIKLGSMTLTTEFLDQEVDKLEEQ